MEKKDLKQIYYLNKEIEMWQRELDKIEGQSILKGQQLTGMPSGSGIADKTGDLATELANIKTIISGKLAEVQIQRGRIINYISSIEDSVTRQVLFYRHVSLMSWGDVAASMGGNNTSEGLRKRYDRFLKKEL